MIINKNGLNPNIIFLIQSLTCFLCMLLLWIPNVSAQPAMTDVTASTGLPTNADNWTMAANDFNNDGNVDLIYTITSSPNWQFFKSNGNGTFTNVTAILGLSISKATNTWMRFVDFDKDGYKDIVYANQQNGSFNLIFLKNNKNTSYVDYTSIANPPSNIIGTANETMDYNADGTIDIVYYVGNDTERSIKVIKSRFKCGNILFDSTALIQDYTTTLGSTVYPIPTTIVDFDGDNDPDIVYVQYCSSCGLFGTGSFYSNQHGVIRNDGGGKFTDVTAASGLGFMPYAQAGWDYNNDGLFDLISGTTDSVSNYNGAHAHPIVYRGDGNCHFTDQTTIVQLYDSTKKYISPYVGDINNDFQLDVYERVAGFGTTLNKLYINNGGGPFTEASVPYGLSFGTGFDHNGGGLWFDIDSDGDKDLVLIENSLIQVMQNNLVGKNWIKLMLNGCESNKDAIAIKVLVNADNKTMVACKGLGTGQGQLQSDLHFGLNNSSTVNSITVYWSNSSATTLTSIAANQMLQINENNNCPIPFPQWDSIISPGAICAGTNVNIKAKYSVAGSPTFQWYLNGNTTGTNSDTYSNASLVEGDKINLVMISGASCTAISDTLIINVAPSPNPVINQLDTTICAGQQIVITAITGTGKLSWTNSGVLIKGANTSSLTVTQSGSYAITETTGNCSATSIADVVEVMPALVANAGSTIYATQGQTVRLNGSGGASYSWSPATGLSNPFIANPSLIAMSDITYTLTIHDTTNICSDSASVEVIIEKPIIIPNAITPNGDGNNDTWQIKNIEGYPNVTYEVFNRWGSIVWKSTGNIKQWDGTEYQNGQPLPDATYFYIINLNSPLYTQAFTGYVQIVK